MRKIWIPVFAACLGLAVSETLVHAGLLSSTGTLVLVAAVPDAADKVAAPLSQSSEAAPATPARRCFRMKTAKGAAERCNDVPE